MNWDWLWWIPVAPFALLLVVYPIVEWLARRDTDRWLESARDHSRAMQREADEYKRLKDARDRAREEEMPA